jgi:lysophospholipase L1-like esterase
MSRCFTVAAGGSASVRAAVSSCAGRGEHRVIQALNTRIRTSRAYDAVIDLDAVARDPNHQTQLMESYQSGDHLHPNDGGYRLMGNAINLDLVKPPARTTTTSSR